jgi:hypothetical protein
VSRIVLLKFDLSTVVAQQAIGKKFRDEKRSQNIANWGTLTIISFLFIQYATPDIPQL